MKKGLIIIGILIITIICFVYIGIKSDENNPCHGGRDTVAEFGEICDYAILGNKKKSILFYREHQKTIEPDVKNYKEIAPYVYVIGSKGYTRLNYNNGEIIQTIDLQQYDANDIKIFLNLEKNSDVITK